MKSNLRWFGVAILLFSWIGNFSVAQESEAGTAHQTMTAAEALHSRGIDLSEKGLISALQNSDPYIRNLAANQLASEGRPDSIPSIEKALKEEKDPAAEAGIALALWVLHDAEGIAHLASMCSQQSASIGEAISAARALETIHESNKNCAKRLLWALVNLSNPDDGPPVLSALTGMSQDLEPAERTILLDSIHNILLDRSQELVMHIVAGDALAKIGSPSSAAILRKALSQETDPNVRSSLERDLSILERKSGPISLTNVNQSVHA